MSDDSHSAGREPSAESPAETAPAVPEEKRAQSSLMSDSRLVARQQALFGGAALGALALAGVMALQSARHGWPFSLHHGYTAGASSVRKLAPTPSSEPSSAHPRTSIMLADAKAAEFGIRVENVTKQAMARSIRAVAVIVPDESRVSEIHTRVAGWIEQLYVNKTGQAVRDGQALAGIFSPDLLAAQNELLAVKKATSAGAQSPLLEGARSRLRVLGMSDEQVSAVEAKGAATRLVTVSSPRKGIVVRRGVAVGTAVDPSTQLMTVADLSRVWVLAEIPERDVPDVAVGMAGALDFPASGAPKFSAKIAFVYPTLTERTRTLRVRFELENPGDRLKPGMYGSATFETAERKALTVARDAVVDTGLEQHVFVLEGPETYVPRKVEVGVDLGDRVEIRSGLAETDRVVASGVFLVDSESRLRASGGGSMAGMKMDSADDNASTPGMSMPTQPSAGHAPSPPPAKPSHSSIPTAPGHAGHVLPGPSAPPPSAGPHAGHGE
ncbi:MAG: efflux RND transporter periplasmic adaptor subunit [Myxococcota bacterium]